MWLKRRKGKIKSIFKANNSTYDSLYTVSVTLYILSLTNSCAGKLLLLNKKLHFIAECPKFNTLLFIACKLCWSFRICLLSSFSLPHSRILSLSLSFFSTWWKETVAIVSKSSQFRFSDFHITATCSHMCKMNISYKSNLNKIGRNSWNYGVENHLEIQIYRNRDISCHSSGNARREISSYFDSHFV